MALSDNYSIPTRERLAMLINEQNNTAFQYHRDFLAGMPKPYGNGLRYNTSLVLYWQGEHLGSAQRIFYRRQSLDTIKRGSGVPLLKVDKKDFYVNDVLPLINLYFGTGFEPGDLVNDRISKDTLFYECRAADTSLAWVGGKLAIGFDHNVEHINTIVLATDLDGLFPPTQLPVSTARTTTDVVANKTPVVAKAATVVKTVTPRVDDIDSIWK